MKKQHFLIASYIIQFVLAMAITAAIYYQIMPLAIIISVNLMLVRFVTKKIEE